MIVCVICDVSNCDCAKYCIISSCVLLIFDVRIMYKHALIIYIYYCASGAMSEAVRYQVKHWKAAHDAGEVSADPNGPAYENGLEDGDVLVSNHPQLAGGSHLPDITVITPIFSGGKIVFFVASRGHHADIGGIAPGSMPPLSKVICLSTSCQPHICCVYPNVRVVLVRFEKECLLYLLCEI